MESEFMCIFSACRTIHVIWHENASPKHVSRRALLADISITGREIMISLLPYM